MTARLLLACMIPAALAAGGCARPQPDDAAARPPSFLGTLAHAFAPPSSAEPADAKATAKLVARSIWGVVPDAPRRKADLRPELIRGSAVAVASDTLLASCRVVGKRRQVGLVRHNKYRIARVVRVDPDRQICALRPKTGPLNPAAGYRSFDDLRVGEAVFAFVNRTSADLLLAAGRLAAKPASGDRFLETALVLPPGTRSAVLFDAQGNLIGLGTAGPTAESLTLAAPLTGSLAPQLANRDLGAVQVWLAALWPSSDGGRRLPPVLFRLGPDRDDRPGTAAGVGGSAGAAADEEDARSGNRRSGIEAAGTDGAPATPSSRGSGDPSADPAEDAADGISGGRQAGIDRARRSRTSLDRRDADTAEDHTREGGMTADAAGASRRGGVTGGRDPGRGNAEDEAGGGRRSGEAGFGGGENRGRGGDRSDNKDKSGRSGRGDGDGGNDRDGGSRGDRGKDKDGGGRGRDKGGRDGAGGEGGRGR